MRLELDNIELSFNGNRVLQGLSFELTHGQVGCLLGASGCGKTTALRVIAGFELPSGGHVLIDGQSVNTLAPEQRDIGMVFQDYALFPHLNVSQNIGFGLHRFDQKERKRRTDKLIDIVGLTEAKDVYPHELSGGQQQRVALARALAPSPKLLLLDEPFSNLDVELRGRLSLEIREILKALGITALLVTHDQQEAFAVADEIGVMRDGRIEQWASPYDLYHRPATRFAADFVGRGVLLPGVVTADGDIKIELGVLGAGSDTRQHQAHARLDVLLRPDDIIHDDDSPTTAVVHHKAFQGADILYTLRLPSGAKVLSLVPSHHNHALGEAIGIRLEADHVVTFEND